MILRTMASAAAAASLLAANVVLLTLFLNPGVSPRQDALALFGCLFLPYLAGGTGALLLLALLASVFQWWPATARPAIEGLPWFVSLALASTLAGAGLSWGNLFNYRHSIPPEFVRALAGSALTLTVAALILVAVLVDTLLFPRRGRGISSALAVLACTAVVVVPLALRPGPVARPQPTPRTTEPETPLRRVILVGIDGLGPELLRDGIARGSLPAFANIVKRGAHGPLATLRPTEGPPIWTTIMTGCLPRDHGVKSFVTYRLAGSRTVYELLPKGAFVGLLERAHLVSTSPVTASSRRRRTLWNALNAFGIPTGVVRLWGTYPIERVQGFMLSHYYHALGGGREAETLHPLDLAAEVRARTVHAADVDRALVSEFVDLSAEVPGDRLPWRRDLVERALAPDMTYQRAASALRSAYDPPFFAMYFYGLDVVGHTFMRFAQPDRFGDVRPEEIRRYGRVVDRYAAYLSQAVGEIVQGLRPGEILIVVSGYGMEPVPLRRRLFSGLMARESRSGTHAAAPDGVILAVGDGIRPGATFHKASVVDVAPTILYLMGLPVARDMDGRVMAEVLDQDFIRANAVSFIPSYENLAVTPLAGQAEADLPPLPEEGP